MKPAREPGYTPFSDAPSFQDEEIALPVSIPAEELQHLTESQDTENDTQTEARCSVVGTVMRFVWQGGSPGDAWLHMTAAQVAIASVFATSLPPVKLCSCCSCYKRAKLTIAQFTSTARFL